MQSESSPSQKKVKLFNPLERTFHEMDLLELQAKLSDFVFEFGEATDDKDLWIDANNLASKSIEIHNKTILSTPDEERKILMIISWLGFMFTYGSNSEEFSKISHVVRYLAKDVDEYKLILKMIKWTSFDKQIEAESKNLESDFFHKFGFRRTVACVVGDAKKLIILEKTLDFISEDDNAILFLKHHQWQTMINILRIKDEFMMTGFGKEMIKPLHDKLILALINS